MSQTDDELAVNYGMEAKHAMRLREFCQGVFKRKKLLIVVRYTNPSALQWHDQKGYEPKPVTVKEGKSNNTGIVVDDEGKELVARDGTRYFSDYDLQGVYELRDTAPPTYYRFFAGNWVKMDDAQLEKFKTREPSVKMTGTVEIGTVELAQFIRAINAHVCRDGRMMFQHGAQDGFLLSGRPVLDADKKTGFLAFEPDGSMRAIANRDDLKAFYMQRKITWAYQS